MQTTLFPVVPTVVSVQSGQIVLLFDTDALTNGTASGFGYYTYTGAATLTVNTALNYSGGIASGLLTKALVTVTNQK